MRAQVYLLKTGERILWKKNHHGFVFVYAGRNKYNQRCYEIRKPTNEQRRTIVFGYLKDHPLEEVRVSFLSEKLGVSDRTIQSDIRSLEEKGIIKRIPVVGENLKQQANRYDCRYGSQYPPHTCTLENLYKPTNPAGFRTWSWDDFKMNEGKSQEQLYGQYMELIDEKSSLDDSRYKEIGRRRREIARKPKEEEKKVHRESDMEMD